MTKLRESIAQATRHLLRSHNARTFNRNNKEFTIELQKSQHIQNLLEVTTWGYDYSGIKIPKTRPELIALRTKLQLKEKRDGLEEVSLRYYLDILHRENN